jgi:hypothetical protein
MPLVPDSLDGLKAMSSDQHKFHAIGLLVDAIHAPIGSTHRANFLAEAQVHATLALLTVPAPTVTNVISIPEPKKPAAKKPTAVEKPAEAPAASAEEVAA